MPKKILILANHYNTLRIFRRELLEEFHRLGHEIIVSIPPCDKENEDILRSYGCQIIPTPEMERRGMNPVKDIALLKRYLRIISKESPDLVISYTIKPNIYGGFACRLRKVPFYANVTGLGSAFQPGRERIRRLVTFLYQHSLKKAQRVFFENEGNKNDLIHFGAVRESQCVVLPGAGVNLEAFSPAPYPDDTNEVRFLFVGRIMQEKGVDELFAAIRQIKPRYPQAQFDFIGWYEDSYQIEVERLQDEGLIRFHGFQPEVRPYIERCHCVVLPSWHEGMSNTLLEAAAMARPLITNRIHGCMEAVIEDISGYLCEKQNPESLVQKMEQFIKLSHNDKLKMGLTGRILMEQSFDKNKVVETTINKFTN